MSFNDKLQAYEAELNRQAKIEKVAEEDKRQQLVSFITKNSKTKAYSLKGLSMDELTRRAQLVADKLTTNKDRKAKRAEMIEELVANDYGSKASVSKWREDKLLDTYKKYKAAKVANPEKFKTSEVSQTSIVRTSGARQSTSKPATKKETKGDLKD